MKDAPVPAILATVGRVLRQRPQTYRQAWYTAFGMILPPLVVFSILWGINESHRPLLAIMIGYALLVATLAGWRLSSNVHRRHKTAREMSTID